MPYPNLSWGRKFVVSILRVVPVVGTSLCTSLPTCLLLSFMHEEEDAIYVFDILTIARLESRVLPLFASSETQTEFILRTSYELGQDDDHDATPDCSDYLIAWAPLRQPFPPPPCCLSLAPRTTTFLHDLSPPANCARLDRKAVEFESDAASDQVGNNSSGCE